MSDLISRSEAIDALKRKQDDGKGDLSRFYNTIIQHDIEAIMQLPPAEPKRGKWTLKSYRWECDQCGCLIRRNPFKGNKWNYNYCPNCGAKMEVNNESN